MNAEWVERVAREFVKFWSLSPGESLTPQQEINFASAVADVVAAMNGGVE